MCSVVQFLRFCAEAITLGLHELHHVIQLVPSHIVSGSGWSGEGQNDLVAHVDLLVYCLL